MTDSTTVNQAEFLEIKLDDIEFSSSSAQAERREHFDPAAMKELVENIKSIGIIQPIVVRPRPPASKSKKAYELVAGERRVIASRKAGLQLAPAMIRKLNDDQALDLQLVENLQREGLHELAEAEGYDTLKKHGMSAVEIAEKVGKSKEYVFGRLKLLALCKDVRAAFYKNEISGSVALEIARISNEKQQKEALKQVGDANEPMSFREARELIQRNFMLRLSNAPFDTLDNDLVRGAGPCTLCLKNSLAQPELFADIKAPSAGVCTDLPCFNAKCKATVEARVKAAATEGQTVLEGKAAKDVFPYGSDHARDGYVRLDGRLWIGGDDTKVKDLIAKDVKPTLVRVVEHGREALIEVVPESAVKKSSSGSSASGRSAGPNPQTIAQKKAKAETTFRQTVYAALRPKLPTKFGRPELLAVADTMFNDLGDDGRKEIARLWFPDEEIKGLDHFDYLRKLEKKIPDLTDIELTRMILDCVYAPDLRAHAHSYGGGMGKPTDLLEAAKRHRVNIDAIKTALAEAKKKPQHAKAGRMPTPTKTNSKKKTNKKKS